MTWELSVARARQLDSGGDPGAKFKPIGALANSTGCVYDPAATTDPYRPQWSSNCFTPGPDNAYDPTMYELSKITTSYGESAQLNLLGSASMARKYHIGSTPGTIEFGGKVRNAHKFDDSYENGWAANGVLPMEQFLGGFRNHNYYGDGYQLRPTTWWDKDILLL